MCCAASLLRGRCGRFWATCTAWYIGVDGGGRQVVRFAHSLSSCFQGDRGETVAALLTDEHAPDAESVGKQASKGPLGRSPGQLAWLRFKRDRVGVVSAVVVLFFFLVGFGAPLIALLHGRDPYTPYATTGNGLLTDTGFPIKPNGGIDGNFWFGIEPHTGRDVFMVLVYGIRTSLLISLAVVLLTTIIGTILGVTAGYVGGRTDYVISRITDTLLSIPSTLFMLAFMPVAWASYQATGQEVPVWVRAVSIIGMLTLFGWTRNARLLRGQVFSLREREFVEAAKVTGAGPGRIIFRELLPNLWTPILVLATLDLPTYVTAEAALSFLGVGITDPTPDWGVMVQNGSGLISSDITYLVFPGIGMIIFVLAFNLLGDSVRDALDPKGSR
ncbi:ABC transporter permease [Nocardia terpenica]|nr:ABC transporter permease [Nocardia terpenica]MBF6105653.1 ABC transporter permease [Nocardia terpenica]MBF6112877.1 ABC transporter permease [Nocardia terpenica]MBF6119007.1 ABC transporter permease [Nocardia terpenica]NQE92115.1 ABC transporter permease [Nocardia terpenica]